MLTADILRRQSVDEAHRYQCRAGCGKAIKLGEVVLHLKLGSNFPYDARNHYFHLSCVNEVIADAPVSDSVAWVDEVREKMIETGDFLVDV